MWHYQIITEWGECLESGVATNEEEMCKYCNRQMKRLGAYNWIAEYMER